MRVPSCVPPLAALTLVAVSGCTGLVAGPQTQVSVAVPVPRDSAWARARRGFTAEVLTVELADSSRGLLVGRRYPRVTAPDAALERCQVLVHLTLAPAADGTTLGWESQWVAPPALVSAQAAPCDTERQELLARLEQTIAPLQ